MKSIFSAPLHLLYEEKVCVRCGLCAALCTTGRIIASEDQSPKILGDSPCISCGQCIAVCPEAALSTNTPAFTAPAENAAYREELDGDLFSGYLKSRRSVRVWQKKVVAHSDLAQLIDVAAYAPSACNIHPVKWVIVSDPSTVQEFAHASIAALKALPGDHPLAQLSRALVASADTGADPVCRNAPALLIAASDADQQHGLIDSIIALSYIDAFAPSIGLGTCWVGYVMIMLHLKPELGRILGIPDDWTPQYAMLAGYPGVSFSQIPPREVPEVVWN
ncbi:MAG: nitroreductase family protein [Methanocalculaceae archaeon]|jgi:nitroreductase/NAD-dependent dihydropyrimidine dehydrogenase PreA subunit|nr:nitroreductase family protein [Methanocalculaceae archaeon]